ncbi:MAG TPA: glutathione S-transferase family protein [Caulobacter sp.]|nr:glutathione S-transferase family protein [Caulobacter sp.]
MTATVTAFKWVPPFAQGFVRDLRIRWALEEAGLPYAVELIGPETTASEAYRQWQPFGQVPAWRDDEVEIFESGAILIHLAGKSEALAPQDPAGLARVTTWIVSGLNSVEPFAQNLATLDSFHAGQPWVEGYRPVARGALEKRLTSLSKWLGDKDWLEGRFTAADIIMVTVLRELVACGILKDFPRLDAYRQRGEDRPAFRKAMADQLATFREHEPA